MAKPIDPAQLLPLLALLSNGEWANGTVLAQELKLSRAAISKQVQHLSSFGIATESHSSRGYRLCEALTLLSKTDIASLLEHDRSRQCEVSVLPQTESTNSYLLSLSQDKDPQIVTAEYQEAGRGRRGRQWQSPLAQHIYLSLSWTFENWPAQLSTVSLLAGVICCERLNARFGIETKLKWPNDLYINGKKLGGILTECRGEPHGSCRVIIGIGINVTHSEKLSDQPWISVADCIDTNALPIDRNQLIAELSITVFDALHQFSVSGFAPLLARFNALDLTRDQQVNVHADNSYSGIARGIDENGALRVETDAGIQLVHAADVSVRLGTD